MNLPNKASELIESALKALYSVEKNPAYVVAMGVWHKPQNGKCRVCFAGAVMAMLGVKPNTDSYPGSFDKDTADKLRALHYLALGSIKLASRFLPELSDMAAGLPRTDMRVYSEDPEGFKEDMRGMADALR